MSRKCHPEQGLAMWPCEKIRKGVLGEVLTGKGVESGTKAFCYRFVMLLVFIIFRELQLCE